MTTTKLHRCAQMVFGLHVSRIDGDGAANLTNRELLDYGDPGPRSKKNIEWLRHSL